jgi:hypothetical protein
VISLGLPGLADARPGDPDLSFGKRGVALGPRGGAGALLAVGRGRTVVAGTRAGEPGGGGARVLVVARFNRRGKLDRSFGGGDGIFETRVTNLEGVVGITRHRHGKLLIGTDDSIVRLTRAGALDESFGVDGFADYFFNYRLVDFAVQGDGKIVVVGIRPLPTASALTSSDFFPMAAAT